MASSTDKTTTTNTNAMTYRFLGNSGLLVSKLALGTWMHFDPNFTVDAWFDVMATAFRHGINFFDTAEAYGSGQAEELLGGAIRKGVADGLWTREDLVISTKIFFGANITIAGPNTHGLSRKHLVEGTRASLKRLQLDYVDVVFCHRNEPFTPVEEVVRAMNFIISQGWAFYWGTSEWSATEIEQACAVADRLGLIRPTAEQPQYNILARNKVEYEFVDLFARRGTGLTVFSPLAMGVLTGKYRNGIPDGTRLANAGYKAFMQSFERDVAIARDLEAIAKRLDCSLAQLAIAWCVTNENVSTVLLGARNVAQLEETVQSMDIVSKLTADVKMEIDAIVKFVPAVPGSEPVDSLRMVRSGHLGDVSVNESLSKWHEGVKRRDGQ